MPDISRVASAISLRVVSDLGGRPGLHTRGAGSQSEPRSLHSDRCRLQGLAPRRQGPCPMPNGRRDPPLPIRLAATAVRMIRNVSQDARLTRLYQKHNRAVRAYCLRRIGDDAADAVAAVFAVAWRRIEDMPADDKALPWLYAVARRVVSDHYRSVKRRQRLAERLSGVRPPIVPQPEWQLIQRADSTATRGACRHSRQ